MMGSSSGKEELQEIINAIEQNPPREHRMMLEDESDSSEKVESNQAQATITPEGTQNPEPPGSGAPFLPNDTDISTIIPGHNATTPTPSGRPSLVPM